MNVFVISFRLKIAHHQRRKAGKLFIKVQTADDVDFNFNLTLTFFFSISTFLTSPTPMRSGGNIERHVSKKRKSKLSKNSRGGNQLDNNWQYTRQTFDGKLLVDCCLFVGRTSHFLAHCHAQFYVCCRIVSISLKLVANKSLNFQRTGRVNRWIRIFVISWTKAHRSLDLFCWNSKWFKFYRLSWPDTKFLFFLLILLFMISKNSISKANKKEIPAISLKFQFTWNSRRNFRRNNVNYHSNSPKIA